MKKNGNNYARPLDEIKDYNKGKKKLLDPNNNVLSLFLNKNNITDFEAVIEKEMEKLKLINV
jgi:hypothetical protein